MTMTARYAPAGPYIFFMGLLVLFLCCSISSAAGNGSDTFYGETGLNDPDPASLVPGLPEDSATGTDPVSSDLNAVIPDSLQNEGQSLSKTHTILSGHVFRGSAGSRSGTLEGVPVELFCSSTADEPGAAVIVTRTDSIGKYEILVEDSCGYYTLAAFPPGMVTRAESEQGSIIEGNRIQFTAPLIKSVIVENNFWADYPKPGDAPLFWNSDGLVLLWVAMFIVGFIIIILGFGVLKGKDYQKRKK
jgi:hypothetical protein